MNDGLFGIPRKRHDAGKLVSGCDVKDSDYISAESRRIIHNDATGAGRRLPALVFNEYETPFYVKSLVWAGTTWVAISETESSTSTDLISWTTPVSLPAKGTNNLWSVVAWNGTMLVALTEAKYASTSNDGFVYTAYSTDLGVSWSSGTSINTGAPFGFPNGPVTWTGSAWIAAYHAIDGILRSTDGINWSRLLTSLGPGFDRPTSNGAGTVIVPKNGNLSYVSTDHGVTWNLATIKGGSLVYDSFLSKFVILPSNDVNISSTSSDLITWTPCPQLGTMSGGALIVVTPDHYIQAWYGAIIIHSKHSADFGKPTTIEFPNSLTLYYGAAYGNGACVMFPWAQVNFNTPLEVRRICMVELDASKYVVGHYSSEIGVSIKAYVKTR